MEPSSDPSLPWEADQALGLELQIEELVEQRQRAIVQHRPDDVEVLDRQIAELYDELAAVAERLGE